MKSEWHHSDKVSITMDASELQAIVTVFAQHPCLHLMALPNRVFNEITKIFNMRNTIKQSERLDKSEKSKE